MKAFAILLTLLLIGSVQASPVNTQGGSNSAIAGYDPVAYFADAKAVEGSRQFSYRWQGADWYFSSAANRQRFIANPEAFAPQYGGYCAYAVANGYTAKVDPEAWRIVEGKLYLNYSKSVQKRWEADTAGYIRRGDSNWPDIRARL
ncbi:YHS domain-containing (seleno)protein [Motiliproteus sediminis]|uniref:YHS domain-containing (seleno)protein n=1 Tax=Motiliproteus sediminis TaxID=1468178 RepID=UPI001AEFF2BB|nr:YHS domain-containing (seleno)protein [Motiliproteus sediminis]